MKKLLALFALFLSLSSAHAQDFYACSSTTANGAGRPMCASNPLSSGTLTLGLPGTASAVNFTNATSGSINVQPPAGALGAAVLTLPSGTDTIVGRATTDTLTNKSIAGTEITTGTVGPTVGGTGLTAYTVGDILSSATTNTLSALHIGSTNQVLTVVGGVPTWSPNANTVANSDSTLTISPTSGAVIASLNLGHANTWTATQGFPNNSLTWAEHPNLSANQIVGALTATVPGGLNIPSCSTSASALLWTSGTGFSCNTAIAATTAGTLTTAISANQVLGSLTAVAPSGLTVPSCAGATNALTWTNGTGFGCNTIAGSGTITTSVIGQVPVFTGTTTIAGNTLFTYSGGFVTLGASGTLGGVVMGNATSGTITLEPTTGALGTVTLKLPAATDTLAAIGTAQTWTGIQTFTNSVLKLLGSSTGATTFTSANASASNFTITVPAATDTLDLLATAQSITAAKTFTNSTIKILGSSTGATTLTSANASASAFTLTLPAVTSTAAVLGMAQTFTATQSVAPSTVTISTATFTPAFANSNTFKILLVHASCPCTIANPSGTIVPGTDLTIEVAQSATGSDLVTTWGSDYHWSATAGGPPTLATSGGLVDLIICHTSTSTDLYCNDAGQFTP